jgi:cobalt/nickel transport protein
MKSSVINKLWIGIVVLALLSPLGIVIPAHFGAGGAWGEWSSGELSKIIGYTPAGMAKIANRYHAPMPDYGFRGDENASLKRQSIGYVVSAFAGVAGTSLVVFLLAMLVRRPKKPSNSSKDCMRGSAH